MSEKEVMSFRHLIEQMYARGREGWQGGFDEILCYELHSQPVNPRMNGEAGLTFKELAQKWGISLSFLGELIADHCRKLEE